MRSVAPRLLVAVAIPVAMLVGYARLTPLDEPEGRLFAPGTVMLGADGTVLSRDTSAGLRIPVRLAQIAPIAVAATIAAEDQRFRAHPGIDPLAAARALVTGGSQPSGASTITQQLARRLYLRDETGQPLARKAREALTALRLEAHRSKDEILALYLNEVYYGRGAYGIEAAARAYFGTSARDLDLAQASLLAGLPQLPGVFDAAGQERAKARQRYVLRRLVATGDITPEAADEAAARQLLFPPTLGDPIAPHFLAYALDELARARPDLAERAGLVIDTTLDPGLQQAAERSVRLRLAELRDKDAGNAAVVVLDPLTGRTLAMVGSAGFDDDAIAGQINMALRARQPGSALKPFLYLASFERGFTAATPLLDVPTTFLTSAGPYTPRNADGRFHGPIPVRTALASSYNVPAVRALDRVGIDAFLEIAHRFGLRTLTDAETYGLALTLGGGEVRLLDLAGAYGALANGGELVEPYAVARVRDAAGRVLYQRGAPAPTRVASREHAFILTDILADPLARLPGFGETSALDTPFGAAVKTGTTTGFRDNWAVGFTPDHVVAVWVGNTDARPMDGVSGVDGAAPIWRDVISVATTGAPPREPELPAGVVRAMVCAPTGLLPGADCPTRVEEWFVVGTEPSVRETYYSRDPEGHLLVDPPGEARAWAAEAGLRLTQGVSRGAPDVHIVRPAPGSVFYLAPELARQTLLVSAAAPAGALAVELRVDGATLARVDGDQATATWTLVPGSHAIEVVATLAGGAEAVARRTFEVRAR